MNTYFTQYSKGLASSKVTLAKKKNGGLMFLPVRVR